MSILHGKRNIIAIVLGLVFSFFSLLLFFFVMIKYPHKVPFVWRIPYVWLDTFDSQPKAVNALNEMRKQCKTRYLIKSAYRPQFWNDLIGGKKNSMHVKGIAFDVIVPMSNREAFYRCAKKSGFTAYGWANNTVHVDMGMRRWWTYGDDKQPRSGDKRYEFLHKAPKNFKKDFGIPKKY